MDGEDEETTMCSLSWRRDKQVTLGFHLFWVAYVLLLAIVVGVEEMEVRTGLTLLIVITSLFLGVRVLSILRRVGSWVGRFVHTAYILNAIAFGLVVGAVNSDGDNTSAFVVGCVLVAVHQLGGAVMMGMYLRPSLFDQDTGRPLP